MTTAAALPRAPLLPVPVEQRMLIHGVTWREYVILREAIDTPGLRMTYCEGTLELMSPSRDHETWKTMIARALELWALELDRPLYGYGSTTFRREARARGAEPDECYCVGADMREGGVPDFVVEVIHTTPLLDKLEVYRGLEVPEVWLYREHTIEVHRLRGGAYARVAASTFVPDLDLALLARYAERVDQHAALRELRDELRRAPKVPARRRPRPRKRGG